ncbi:MAG TPA: hypothetical protein PKM25_19580, partial [Candidatus Ozemobacteraceae bacterium]|nr:hypothetical protein [Candidatus Ozemobacteraceae bacterium]
MKKNDVWGRERMKGFRFQPEILRELAGITELEGEYVSHATALSLLGILNESCTVITVVTPRRRRNRSIGKFPLIFINHGSDRPAHIR